jgi:Alpha-2,8-polysialyltransferase (POLYST)
MIPVRLPYDEAVQRVREDVAQDRCSFVARVNTPWTILGLEAWLRRAGPDRVGHVLVVSSTLNSEVAFSSPLSDEPHVSVSISTPRTDRSRRPTNIRRLLGLPPYLSLLARGRTTRAPIDVLSAREADVGFLLDLAGPLTSRDVRLQILDEGFGRLPVELGTQTGPALNNAQLRARGSSLRYAGVLLGARARVASASLVGRRLPLSEHNLIQWDPSSRRSVVVPDVRDSYRAVLAMRPRIPLQRRTSTSRLALFATHPVSDYLNASVEVEAKIAERIVETLLEQGFDVLIKQHPREREAKYEPLAARYSPRVRTLSGAIPAEQLFASLHPIDVVVGYTGQSLLSASVLFDVQAYSVTSVLGSFDFSRAQLADYRAYDGAMPRGTVRPFEDLASENVHASAQSVSSEDA